MAFTLKVFGQNVLPISCIPPPAHRIILDSVSVMLSDKYKL